MEEKIYKSFEELPEEDFLACLNGGKMDWVAVKKPRGVIVKKLKSGITKIVVEMTQDQLNDTMKRVAERQLQKEPEEINSI